VLPPPATLFQLIEGVRNPSHKRDVINLINRHRRLGGITVDNYKGDKASRIYHRFCFRQQLIYDGASEFFRSELMAGNF
jgi:hypothetical protein